MLPVAKDTPSVFTRNPWSTKIHGPPLPHGRPFVSCGVPMGFHTNPGFISRWEIHGNPLRGKFGKSRVFFFFLGGVLKQIPEFVYLIPSESISWSADAASLKQFLEHLAQSRRWPSWIEDPQLALNPAHSASDNWVYPETGYVYIIIYYDILIIY